MGLAQLQLDAVRKDPPGDRTDPGGPLAYRRRTVLRRLLAVGDQLVLGGEERGLPGAGRPRSARSVSSDARSAICCAGVTP